MSLLKTLKEIESQECGIEVYGLGYVGFPLSILLAFSGFKVIGIDSDSKKIQRLKENSLTELELSLKNKFLQVLQSGNLILSEHSTKLPNSKIAIICVPTPIPDMNRQSDIFVKSAVENFLSACKIGDVIILESSIEVGTTERIKQVIESRGFKVGKDIGLSFCAERIDPLNTKWKLENIPRIIYCSDDNTFQIAKKIYHHVNNSNLIRVNSSKIAEVVKSFENTFRLVNISLVNELAVLCDKLQINVNDVIEAASTKPFGFLKFYPSAGAGGHCIPKDPVFLLNSARNFGFEFKTIENALKINSFMPKYIADSIEKILDEMKLLKSIIVYGLSYKPNTEDMRDSPGFKIIDELKSKNFKVAAYDPYFQKELITKYLAENNKKELNFEILTDINDSSIQGYDCICIVQHHTVDKFRLEEIYENSLVPVIYDCQNKLTTVKKSETVIKTLGS